MEQDLTEKTLAANVLNHDSTSLFVTVWNNTVNRLPRGLYVEGYGKRMIDILLSIILLIICMPLLIPLLVVIKYDGGPALYLHERVGLGGRSFNCLKLRTMVTGADTMLATLLSQNPIAQEQWQNVRKLHYDPRVTRLGRILRRTSLDELPQLINVLRGDMSLVGPRPIVQDEFDKFYHGSAGNAYASVRPGLTGLWQVSGRSEIGYAERIALDVSYIQELSLRSDLCILLRTVPAVLRKRGAC